MRTSVFETSNQILRLNKLIDHLKGEINTVRLSITDLMAKIEDHEKSILKCPRTRQNTRLRMEINEMNRELLKCRQKIMEYERKLSKNMYLRQSKISTLPDSSTSHKVGLPIDKYQFDWESVLKFVN